MAPFLILVLTSLGLRASGWLGAVALRSWATSVRVALAVMFTFTGVTHFTTMKYDYLRMIPEGLPSGLWVIYLTGGLEIAGAAGLFVPQLRRIAGIGLLLLLCALFPANVHAALQDVPFRDAPPMNLWLRGPIQLVFAAAVWWSAARPSGESSTDRASQA